MIIRITWHRNSMKAAALLHRSMNGGVEFGTRFQVSRKRSRENGYTATGDTRRLLS